MVRFSWFSCVRVFSFFNVCSPHHGAAHHRRVQAQRPAPADSCALAAPPAPPASAAAPAAASFVDVHLGVAVVAVQVEKNLRKQNFVKQVFHFIGSRVETRWFQAYGSQTAFNLCSPAWVMGNASTKLSQQYTITRTVP